MSRKDNFGPGGFGDQYDNGRMRSMDRDQHPGGITGVPFEDDIDMDNLDFNPHHGESYLHRLPHERKPGVPLDVLSTPHQDYYGKGPKGWKISDEKLKDKVCDVLLQSHEVDASEMEVTVKEGVVNLKGNISSKGMRRVAEDLIESIPGVLDVFTQLKIKDTSNFQLSHKTS